MPRVPYNPAPTLDLIQGGLPSVRPNAPEGAFGAETARATEGLGRALDKSGDELFARAMAMQDLNNHTQAEDAANKFIIESGKLHAEFMSKEGKARVDAYDGYIKNLDQLRQSIGDDLPNDAVKRLYDSSSRSTYAHTIFNANGAAASANRQYAKTTIQSQIELDGQAIEDNPKNPVLIEDKITRIKNGVRQLSALDGEPVDSPNHKLLELTAVSGAYRRQITGLSRTNPTAAMELLNEVSGQLTEKDKLALDGTVRSAFRSVGAPNLANEVWDPGKPLADMEKEVREKAAKQFPDDPVFSNYAVQSLQALYNQKKRADAFEVGTARQTVAEAIGSGVRDVQQLRAKSPEVAAAMDRLPATERDAIPAKINSYNRARDYADNQDRTAQFERLKGMYITDRASFMEQDFTAHGMTQAQINNLENLRSKALQHPIDDPRVPHAISVIRFTHMGEVQALGLQRRDPNNPDLYDRYAGAVQTAYDAWVADKKRRPSDKEIAEEIGPMVISQVTPPTTLFGVTLMRGTARFEQEAPKQWLAEERKRQAEKGNLAVPDSFLQNGWARQQYQKLIEAQKKRNPEAPSNK